MAPKKNILIYDNSGDHPALQAAEVAASSGARVEVVTYDRTFSPEIMGMNLVPYMRALQDKDVAFTVTRRLQAVAKQEGGLVATIGTDYSDHSYTKTYDQIVVTDGTIPLDDLYFALKNSSSNKGQVDYQALIEGHPQAVNQCSDKKVQEDTFQLFRIGDAVSARNTHAAIYRYL